MNQLETNLALWAICSILLFELLIIICLCRCCFNRIKPKRFYVKKEEYEHLQDFNNGTQSKFQSTILRPPHADELALVGTIRGQNPMGTYNGGFYLDDKDERISSIQPQSSQHWIELQSPIINTAQLPPADYEIHSYPTDDYSYRQLPPRSTILDFYSYQGDYVNNDIDEIENYRPQYLRRPEVILPQVRRIDTSTEASGINYSNIVPKSILKSGTSTTPPPQPSVDLLPTPYLQIQRSRTSSKDDELPRTSVKINTDQSIPVDYPSSVNERRIPIEPILSPTILLPSKHRMKFANISQLNDTEWEVPREFQTVLKNNQTFHSDHQRSPPAIIDSKLHIPWQREMKISQSHYLSNDDITQQQAFEY